MARPEDMNEHELLAELLKSQKSDARAQKYAAFGALLLAAIIAAVSIIMVPRAIQTLNNVNNTLQQVNEKLTQVEAAITQVQSTMSEVEKTVVQAQDSLKDIDEMVGNVNELVEANTEGLTNTVTKINEIDFQKLNDSIADLNAVIEPLSKLFRR